MAVAANKRSIMTLFSDTIDIYSHQARIVLAEKGGLGRYSTGTFPPGQVPARLWPRQARVTTNIVETW